MAQCLLALGSNLGNRQTMLQRACAEIARLPATQLLVRSDWHGTIPIGGADDQGEFLNSATIIETALPPHELTAALLAIESQLGRERVVRWDARIIDIDLLLYGREIIESPDLIVPHPRMSFRKFVLQPAAEIAGSMLHPTSGWTIAALLSHLQSATRHVVITASDQKLAQWLAVKLCEDMRCTIIEGPAEKNSCEDVSASDKSLKSSGSEYGKPPTLELQSLCAIRDGRENGSRAALTIFLDSENSTMNRLKKLNCFGLGPVARITSNDSATIMQEAEAALRSIWPDLSSTIS